MVKQSSLGLLISLGATLPAATREYAHTPSVKDQGWRRARAAMGPTIIPKRPAWETILPDVDLHQLHRFSAAAGTLARHYD